MRGTIFKVVKTISSILGSYLWLIYLTVMAMICFLESTGKLSLPENVSPYFDKALELTLGHYNVLLYVSIISVILIILLSNTNKILQIGSVVCFVFYMLVFPSLYDKLTSLILEKTGFNDLLLVSFVNLLGYLIVTVILEVCKSVIKVGKLQVTEKVIKHKKVDDLIKEYYSEDVKFNMSVCEDLIKKYGGAN